MTADMNRINRCLLAMTELQAGHAPSVVDFPPFRQRGGCFCTATLDLAQVHRGRTFRSCRGLHPARRRAKGAPLLPGSVAAAGGKLEGTHTRRSCGKLGRTRDLGYELS
ncbi:transcriptional regulator, AraC family [Trichinella spiralis]|uniref:transcriptional regulator, AraC family n=1 Tax=Trichinella spiralis TaxID=6334 RepID=UPI0001EFDC4A|nr:transcriptional regulator, AraC family [Trichinella spiralis]